MSWQDSLLADPGPWEMAVEAVSASFYPLPWAVLRTLHDPDHIPANLLPILAWELSVDIWHTEWPIEKKRAVTWTALADQRLVGTMAGVRRYLDIEDAELVEYLTPPQMFFASPDLTKAQMDGWLASLPQLRIYWQSKPGFDDGYGYADVMFADDGIAGFDAGAALYGRFPVIYDNGVETPLKVSEIITTATEQSSFSTERVSVPGIAGPAYADVDFEGQLFADGEVKAPLLYTIRLDQSYIHEDSALALTQATPGLSPVDVRFTRGSTIGDAGLSFFVGDFADNFYASDDLGAYAVFDMVYLNDPARIGPIVDCISFADHSRIGFPSFTMELMVKAESVTFVTSLFEGDFFDDAYAMDEDLTRIGYALDAIALSKGFENRALVTFETDRPRTWGDGIPLDGTVNLSSRLPASL